MGDESKPRARFNPRAAVLWRLEVVWEDLQKRSGEELELQDVLDRLLPDGEPATIRNLNRAFTDYPKVMADTGKQ
jgi:hypothetical protein